MPHGDSDYIPRNWADALKQSVDQSLAEARQERTQSMLEPLRQDWTDEDKAWLCALRIKVN